MGAEEDDGLSPQRAAEYIHDTWGADMSVSSVRRWALHGALGCTRSGSRVLISRRRIDELMSELTNERDTGIPN